MGRSGRSNRSERPAPYKRNKSSSSDMMVDADDGVNDQPVVRREKAIPRSERMDTAETQELNVSDATRGQMLQRHKREYRELRDKLAEMKESRRKLNRRDNHQNLEKKEMGKQMKSMMEALQKRHERELAEFDAARSRKEPTKNVHLDLQSINLNFGSLGLGN